MPAIFNTTLTVERPLPNSFAPHSLIGDKLLMIPMMPDHQMKLHADIFSQPHVMQYFGTGKSFTFDEFSIIHLSRVNQNLTPKYDDKTGRLSTFTWTLLTDDGIAGRFNIFQSEGRTEVAFCVSPTQQGRNLALRASELVVKYLGRETSFIATAHPENHASIKTLERIRYPEGKFVFFKDPTRQNVIKYGPNQPRHFYLSKEPNTCSFYSFRRRDNINLDLSDPTSPTNSNI